MSASLNQKNPIAKRTINNFFILAERDSGTNYMTRLMTSFFGLNITWEYGPKHFFGWVDERIKASQNTLFVCMVRNPYDWLSALFKTKHHVPFQMKTFDKFLLSEWYSIHHEEFSDKQGQERLDDRYWKDNTRHKNIFQMRQRKLLYLKETVPTLTKNYHYIRYEDLCKNTSAVMIELSEKFQIPIVNSHLEKSLVKSPYRIRKEYKEIIDKNIDWDTECLFGYYRNQRRF